MSNIKPITFNIGGQRYEISRSLLDQFPESMLTNCASGQWLENPEEEIFIERDGAVFRYILNYMRDGSVFLPVTERKQSFIKELDYYGIEARNSDINDGKAKLEHYSFELTDSLHPELKKFRNQMEYEKDGLKLAIFCTDEFFKYHHSNLFSSTSQKIPNPIEIAENTNAGRNGDDSYKLLQKLFRRGYPVIASANRQLGGIGLKVISINERGQRAAQTYIDTSTYSVTLVAKDPTQSDTGNGNEASLASALPFDWMPNTPSSSRKRSSSVLDEPMGSTESASASASASTSVAVSNRAAAAARAGIGWGNCFANVPEGQWKCNTCLSPNDRDATQCAACEALKP